jgi:hypothetical protein
MLAAVKRNHGSAVRLAFKVWGVAVAESTRFDLICKRVLRRWQLMSVSSCFRGWCDYCVARRHARKVAGRVFGRMVHGRVASAWASWVGVVAYLRRYEFVCGKAASRLKQRYTVRAFGRWCDYCVDRQHMRYLVSALLVLCV